MKQMSIFDFMPKKESLDELSEEEMVQIISDATGLNFMHKSDLFGWTAKKGKTVFDIKYSNFRGVHDNARFISCGWKTKTEGCGVPCISIEEAINFMKTAKKRT